jgi:hypothetical protein
MVKMTDKELAIAILKVLGYERENWERRKGWWVNGGSSWYEDDVLSTPDSHIFAAEVKLRMMRKGYGYHEDWFFVEGANEYAPDGEGGIIEFCRDDPCDYGANAREFTRQEWRPRAVCEAAIAALKVDRGNDGKDD